MQTDRRRLTCAIFVDFDNAYSALRTLDEDSAAAFANSPLNWLEQLRDGADEDGPFARRFLQKSLYLNPAPYGQHRATFTRAGFRVVDCPSLTRAGKSSADMWMAVDILDAIAHPTGFDEFLIISSDADFTPLVHRIRAYNRRVTLVTVGFAASAYRANADQVIDAAQFAEVLGAAPEPGEVKPAPASQTQPNAPSEDPDQAQAIVAPSAPHAEQAMLTPEQETLRVRAAQAIADLVGTASGPVPASAAAAAARSVDPSLSARRWDGLGFMGWVEANLEGVGTQNAPGPGFVWDSSRFDAPGGDHPLSPLQVQVASITEIPGLTEEQYGSLHSSLAQAISEVGLSLSRTPSKVRDLLANTYPPVSLRAIKLVVRGLLLDAGTAPSGTPTPAEIASAWADLVVALAEGSRIDLTDNDRHFLRKWLGGGLTE